MPQRCAGANAIEGRALDARDSFARRRRSAFSFVLIACLLAAGTGACVVAPAASVPPTVKIGLVAPFEGRYRDTGYDVIWAVRLAVREYNLARAPGAPVVDLVAYDDAGNPEMAVEQVRKLDVDPQVVGAIGHWRPETTRAAARRYADLALPLVTAEQASGQGVFSLAPDDASMALALVHLLNGAMGVGGVAIVGPQTSMSRAFSSTFEAEGGRVLLQVEPGSGDWVGRVRNALPEAVYFSGDSIAAADALNMLTAGRVHTQWAGGPSLASGEFLAIAGAQAEGALLVTGRALPADLPALDDFPRRYSAVAFGGAAPGPNAAPAYDAARLLLDALRRVSAGGLSVTRANIASALVSARRDGLIGSIYFNAQRQWPAAPVTLYLVRRGQLTKP